MKWNRLVCLVALILWTAPAFAQQHADVVASVKAQLQQAGVSLAGSCGAFEITKRVAWALRMEGVGLISKPDGEQCQGFSTDKVMYADGRGFDLLIDGGGANGPSWNGFTLDPGLYRPAIDPGGGVIAPPVVPPVIVPTLDLSGLYSRLDALYAQNDRNKVDDDNQRAVQTKLIQTLDEHLTHIDNEPGWLQKVLTNPWVIGTAGTITALLAGRYAIPANQATPAPAKP